MNYLNKVFDFKEHVPPNVKEALRKIGNLQMKCECGAFWENSWKAEGEDESAGRKKLS